MKITFFELKDWERTYFKDKLIKHKLLFVNEPLDEKNASKAKDSDIVCIFVNSEITEHVLEKMKKIKYVITMSTGFDHINLKACKAKKIKVSNIPSYGENTVAEYAFALILALSRKIHMAINKTRKDNFSIDGLEGFDLKDKTLGVIGAGRIGQHVIKMAKAFEMNVIAFNPNKNPQLAKKLGFKYVSLPYLLNNSDIITIHAPLTKQTHHLLNLKNINQIKKGAFLVNTARGEIIDTTALIKALDKNILAGAALDVLEGEENIADEKELINKKFSKSDMVVFLENHQLLKKRNVIITPHSAFFTREALIRILEETILCINNYKESKIRNKIA